MEYLKISYILYLKFTEVVPLYVSCDVKEVRRWLGCEVPVLTLTRAILGHLFIFNLLNSFKNRSLSHYNPQRTYSYSV